MSNPHVTRGYGVLEGILAKKRANIADKLIPSSHRKGRILDIGCGTYPLFLINTEFADKYALDKCLAKNNDKIHKHKISPLNHDLEVGSLLPYDNNMFDVVTMLAVLEHIEPKKLVVMLSEIHRILKTDGIYIMTTPASWTENILKIMAQLNLVSSIEIEEHKGNYNPSMISTLLQDAAFSKSKIKIGYFEMFMNIWAMAIK